MKCTHLLKNMLRVMTLQPSPIKETYQFIYICTKHVSDTTVINGSKINLLFHLSVHFVQNRYQVTHPHNIYVYFQSFKIAAHRLIYLRQLLTCVTQYLL